MTVDTVTPAEDHVNASADQVSAWADRAGERGLLNPTTARLKVTALRRILSVLADDEMMGAQEILANLDALVVRLARKEGGNPETLGTYKQRAESILRDFLDYHNDPLAFQNKNAERSAKVTTKPTKPAEKKKAETGVTRADAPASESNESAGVGTGRRFAFPLSGGREFVYILPPDGIRMNEVMRIGFHLGSMATDFDPSATDMTELTRRVRNQRDNDDTGDHNG